MENMPIVIFDADGVVIKKAKVFSVRWSEAYGVPMEKMLEFFKGEFGECLVGKRDLKETLPKWLDYWGTPQKVETVLDYWFSGEAEVVPEVMAEITALRQRGIKCYLATNNERWRVDYLNERVGLGEKFDGIFSSAELGAKKPHKEFFEKIEEAVGATRPEEIWFWDDDAENVEGAHNAGWHARLYSNIKDFREEMRFNGGES